MGIELDAARRYALYAAIIVIGGVVYWWLGVQQPSGPGARPGARADFDTLPPLGTLDSEGEGASLRDLFAYGEPERPPVEAAPPPAAIVIDTPAPDLFADVKVIGLVRRGGATSVFVQAGAGIRAVRVGDRFGEQNSLSVKSVSGRDVTIVNMQSNTSKVFTLSEE